MGLGMLKHKIRKSRKNILSLLESVQVAQKNDTTENSNEYAEVRKKGKKEKNKQSRNDEGYYTEKSSDTKTKTKDRCKSETRAQHKRTLVRNEETQTHEHCNVTYLIPLLVPCTVFRRSSPQEDYIQTLGGVKTLIEQQNNIVKQIKKSDKKVTVDNKSKTSFV